MEACDCQNYTDPLIDSLWYELRVWNSASELLKEPVYVWPRGRGRGGGGGGEVRKMAEGTLNFLYVYVILSLWWYPSFICYSAGHNDFIKHMQNIYIYIKNMKSLTQPRTHNQYSILIVRRERRWLDTIMSFPKLNLYLQSIKVI